MRGGLWRRLLAGQVDSAVSALSGLAAALYAARHLSPTEMGAYGIFFAIFGLTSQLPTQLVMSPAATVSVQYEPELRLGILRRSAGLGALVGLGTAALVPLGLLQVSDVTPGVVLPLAVTASLLSLLSPVQDHIRSMFHIANQSWKAATTAGVYALGTAGGILWIQRFGIAWVPFGSMVLGNALSIGFGLTLARPVSMPPLPRLGELWSIGKSLTATGLATAGGTYLVATIVELIAGPETLGLFETARVTARPLQVVGLGLIAVISPQLMAAAMKGEQREAARYRNAYWLVTAFTGAAYLGLFAFPSRFNPLVALVPNAYLIPGLAAAAIMGNIAWNASMPLQSELVAAGWQRKVASLELGAQLVRSALAFVAAVVGAFAIPITLVVGAVIRTTFGLRYVRKLYPKSTKRSHET